MTHYVLDVDPAPVEQAAQRLDRAGEALDQAGRAAQRTASGWASGWRADTATAATAEIEGIATLLSRGSAALQGAARALNRLADAYRAALEQELPALNRRREAALAAYDAAGAAAQRAFAGTMASVPDADRAQALSTATAARGRQLAAASAERAQALRATDAAYDDLVERLRALTRATGAALAADPPVSVPDMSRALYTMPGFLGGLAGPLDPAGALAELLPLGALTARLQDPPQDPAELAALLAEARAAGLPPVSYQEVLRRHWLAQALAAACISGSAWNPSLGAEANRQTIEAVYRYYGSLYLNNPDLEWAGMAALIGPSFAGGFYDLALLRNLSANVPRRLRSALPPGSELLGTLTAADIHFYETKLLEMQKRIFEDQATQHQAYVEAGLPAMQELHAAGLLSPESLRAWQDIASGVPSRVAAGNKYHLLREQSDIISRSYDEMRHRLPTGPAVTWAMTFAGAPSIPGARSYPDVFPAMVEQGTPGPRRVPFVGWDNPTQVTVAVSTPFPDGNISTFDHRWALIEQDTLPAFRTLLEQDPGRVRALLQTDVSRRIEEFRLAHRWPELVAQMGDWDVEVRQ